MIKICLMRIKSAACCLLSFWVLSALPTSAVAADAAVCEAAAQAIPARSASAPSASQFVAAVTWMSEPQRDSAMRTELLTGNLPGFLRQVQPLHLTLPQLGGRSIRLTLCVLADYLSLGSDSDFLRLPLGLDTALVVAASFGFTLPTRSIVNLIYRSATVQLTPQPMPAGDAMRTTDYFVRHNALVQLQKDGQGGEPSALTAGHKKDLVLTPRLWTQPGRVAIYGWHRSPDRPIQPLSTVHGVRYADYSHGVRLVSRVVYLDGLPRSIFELLADTRLAPWLSDEGVLPRAAELQRGWPTPALGLLP
jgi:hypothetical protein